MVGDNNPLKGANSLAEKLRKLDEMLERRKAEGTANHSLGKALRVEANKKSRKKEKSSRNLNGRRRGS